MICATSLGLGIRQLQLAWVWGGQDTGKPDYTFVPYHPDSFERRFSIWPIAQTTPDGLLIYPPGDGVVDMVAREEYLDSWERFKGRVARAAKKNGGKVYHNYQDMPVTCREGHRV